MSSADVNRASLHEPKLIATLTSLTDDLRATTMRIMAYLCGVAVLALVATDIASRLQDDIDLSPRLSLRQSAWHPVERPIPGLFRVARQISPIKQRLTRSCGTPKAAARTCSSGLTPEWRCPGPRSKFTGQAQESPGFAPASLEIGARTALWNVRDVQADGVIESKFGPISLVAFSAKAAGKRLNCTGFARSFDDPQVQISGWTCGGAAAKPGGRQAVACLLNRLTLLAAGSDPKLAELFARSELKRQADCGSAAFTSESWLTTLDEPELRGAVATN